MEINRTMMRWKQKIKVRRMEKKNRDKRDVMSEEKHEILRRN